MTLDYTIDFEFSERFGFLRDQMQSDLADRWPEIFQASNFVTWDGGTNVLNLKPEYPWILMMIHCILQCSVLPPHIQSSDIVQLDKCTLFFTQ